MLPQKGNLWRAALSRSPFLCYNIFMKITLVLHNIRSTYNVGAILRTAEGFGIDAVVLSGYTPRYNDPNLLPHLREKLNHQIAKSALGAEELVSQKPIDDLPGWLEEQKAAGAQVLGLENNLDAKDEQRKVELGNTEHHTNAQLKHLLLILGEEVNGIPPEIRALCDYFLEIPMYGRKESFNVSVAAGIAMWELSKLRK